MVPFQRDPCSGSATSRRVDRAVGPQPTAIEDHLVDPARCRSYGRRSACEARAKRFGTARRADPADRDVRREVALLGREAERRRAPSRPRLGDRHRGPRRARPTHTTRGRFGSGTRRARGTRASKAASVAELSRERRRSICGTLALAHVAEKLDRQVDGFARTPSARRRRRRELRLHGPQRARITSAAGRMARKRADHRRCRAVALLANQQGFFRASPERVAPHPVERDLRGEQLHPVARAPELIAARDRDARPAAKPDAHRADRLLSACRRRGRRCR